jgi:hypothetical protein
MSDTKSTEKMRKKIYAYYKPILQIDQDEQFAQANVWKVSWERAGWECVMLNPSHAAMAPQSAILQGKIAAISRNTPGLGDEIGIKLQAKFARWGALFGVGGGWMSDYDVVNLGFTPAMAEEIEKEADIAMNTLSPAWIFFASHREAYEACKDFVERPLFKVETPSEPETEAEILGIDKNYFEGIATLAHVRGTKKSVEMRRIFNEYINPGVVEEPRERARNRR